MIDLYTMSIVLRPWWQGITKLLHAALQGGNCAALERFLRSLSPVQCTLTSEVAPNACSCLQYCKEPLRSFFERFLEVFEPWAPEETAASDSAASHKDTQRAAVGCRAGHPSAILAAIVEAVERISTDFGRGRCKETMIIAHSRAYWLAGLNRGS